VESHFAVESSQITLIKPALEHEAFGNEVIALSSGSAIEFAGSQSQPDFAQEFAQLELALNQTTIEQLPPAQRMYMLTVQMQSLHVLTDTFLRMLDGDSSVTPLNPYKGRIRQIPAKVYRVPGTGQAFVSH
jgi:hypothetical protein